MANDWDWDDHRSEAEITLAEINNWLDKAARQYGAKKGIGDIEGARELKRNIAPLFAASHELSVALQFKRTVPIPWTHDATDAELEARIASPAIIAAANECSDGKRNVVFLGKTGVGKSTGFALGARKFYQAQRRWQQAFGYQFTRVTWVVARDLAAATMAYPLGKGTCPAVEQAQEADVLVLDDLGLERDHGAILDVMQARYQFGRVTWVTSGLNVVQLVERYGEAFYRRLVEMNGTAGKVVTAFSKTPGRLAAV
jgi:DNA replication protein DnaC